MFITCQFHKITDFCSLFIVILLLNVRNGKLKIVSERYLNNFCKICYYNLIPDLKCKKLSLVFQNEYFCTLKTETLQREIKDDPNRWRDMLSLWIGRQIDHL